MDISMRSLLTAGVTAATACAIVTAPAVASPAAPSPEAHKASVMLSAAVQPFVRDVRSFANAAGPGVAAAAVGTLASGNAIMDFYNAAEPWVQYGFELATYAVGWIPVVGVFSGQIMVAFYTGEPIVRSLFQSAQYLVDGNWGAIPSTLVNGVVQGGTAFVQQEINWVLGFFPPFPPLPPLPFTAAAAQIAAVSAATAPQSPLVKAIDGLVDAVKHITDIPTSAQAPLSPATPLQTLATGNVGTAAPAHPVAVSPEAAADVGDVGDQTSPQAATPTRTPRTLAKSSFRAEPTIAGATAKATDDADKTPSAGDTPGTVTKTVKVNDGKSATNASKAPGLSRTGGKAARSSGKAN